MPQHRGSSLACPGIDCAKGEDRARSSRRAASVHRARGRRRTVDAARLDTLRPRYVASSSTASRYRGGTVRAVKDEWRAKLMPRIRDCLVKQMDRAVGPATSHPWSGTHSSSWTRPAVRRRGPRVMEARRGGRSQQRLQVYGRFEMRLRRSSGEAESGPGADC